MRRKGPPQPQTMSNSPDAKAAAESTGVISTILKSLSAKPKWPI